MKTRLEHLRAAPARGPAESTLAMLTDPSSLMHEAPASVKIRTLREILKLRSYLSIAYRESHQLLRYSHPKPRCNERFSSQCSPPDPSLGVVGSAQGCGSRTTQTRNLGCGDCERMQVVSGGHSGATKKGFSGVSLQTCATRQLRLHTLHRASVRMLLCELDRYKAFPHA